MNNTKNIARKLIVYNSLSLGVVLLIQLLSSSIGKYLLNSKIKFTNEDASYWIAQSIETDTVQGLCLLIGVLNISLIAVSVNHLLKEKS